MITMRPLSLAQYRRRLDDILHSDPANGYVAATLVAPRETKTRWIELENDELWFYYLMELEAERAGLLDE